MTRKKQKERMREREKWETWTERKVYVTENSNNFVPLLLNHKLKYLFTSISKSSCQHERLIPRTITKLGDFYHLMISFREVRFVKFGIFQSRRNSESRHMNCCKVDIDLKTELFKPRLWVNFFCFNLYCRRNATTSNQHAETKLMPWIALNVHNNCLSVYPEYYFHFG